MLGQHLVLVALHRGLQLLLSKTTSIGDKLPDDSEEVPKPNRVVGIKKNRNFFWSH
jgi:hypothetical protein